MDRYEYEGEEALEEEYNVNIWMGGVIGKDTGKIEE